MSMCLAMGNNQANSSCLAKIRDNCGLVMSDANTILTITVKSDYWQEEYAMESWMDESGLKIFKPKLEKSMLGIGG